MSKLLSPDQKTLNQENQVAPDSAAAPSTQKEALPAEITSKNPQLPVVTSVRTEQVEPPHTSSSGDVAPKRQRIRLGKKKGKKSRTDCAGGFKKTSTTRVECYKVAIHSLISQKQDIALTAKFTSTKLTLADADDILKMLARLREVGHVSRFLRLAGYIANSVVLVLAAGTDAYDILRKNLCSGVSNHTTTDYQKVAIQLMRRVIQESATGQDLFGQVEALAPADDTIWVLQMAKILSKDRSWAANVSLRACLEYMGSKNLSTDRALREHLNLPVRGLPGAKKIKPKNLEAEFAVADEQQKQEIIKTFQEKTPSSAAKLPPSDNPLEPTDNTPTIQPIAPEPPKKISVGNVQNAAESETIWHTYLSALPNIFANSPKETRAQKVLELFAVFKKITGLPPA